MTRSFLLAVIILLSLVGIADSWYLYQSAVTDTALTCDIGAGLDGCNVVAQSPYSQFLGFPLALYGVVFFSGIFVLASALLVVRPRILYQLLFLGATIGALASIGFLFIQVALIQAFCIYCIASALVAFLLLASVWQLWKRFKPVTLVTVIEPS